MSNFGKCAQCGLKNRICLQPDGSGPAFCSTKLYSEVVKQATAEYDKNDIGNFARMAALQEAECYIDRETRPAYKFPVKPRLQEIIEFSRKMGYKRLGVAFCMGLKKEAAIFCKILEAHGFEVVSVICKVGGNDKTVIGLPEEGKIWAGCFESMCNPVAQAKILNEAGTEFNILLGLCVGHDSLFIKYSEAMVTIFAVKDRLLGHNPLAAIYNFDSYYERFAIDRLKDVETKTK